MKKKRFESNSTYFTIAVYTIIVIIVACVVFRVVFNWGALVNVVKNLFNNMTGFWVGILIAFIVSPFVNYIHDTILLKHCNMKRGKLSKCLAILFAYVIVLGFIAICLVFIIPQLITSITDLGAALPGMFNMVSNWLNNLITNNEVLNNDLFSGLIEGIVPEITSWLSSLVSQVIPWLYSVLSAIVQWIVAIIIALVVSVYLLSDKKIIFYAIKKILYAIFSERHAKRIIEICKDCNKIFTGYIIAKAIDSLIIGVLCFVLMLILGLPYAVLISVIVGIMNMIPYFGPIIGAIPGLIILFVSNWMYGLIFLIMILCLQQFDGLVLGPRLLGNSTGVRPILILFAITFGGAYFGVFGMFLGVPVIAVVQYLVTLLLNRRLKRRGVTIEAPPGYETETLRGGLFRQVKKKVEEKEKARSEAEPEDEKEPESETKPEDREEPEDKKE